LYYIPPFLEQGVPPDADRSLWRKAHRYFHDDRIQFPIVAARLGNRSNVSEKKQDSGLSFIGDLNIWPAQGNRNIIKSASIGLVINYLIAALGHQGPHNSIHLTFCRIYPRENDKP
jgi:hypothetical protein